MATTNENNEKCDSCDATGCKLMNCSRCSHAKYCSKECQRSHYSEHKTDCIVISSMKKKGHAGLAKAIRYVGWLLFCDM